MSKRCVVPSCPTGRRGFNEKLSKFKVPLNDIQRKAWEENFPQQIFLKPGQLVCEKHFSEDVIMRRYIHRDDTGKIIANVLFQRPHLAERACPTIFDNRKEKIETTKSPLPLANPTESVITSVKVNFKETVCPVIDDHPQPNNTTAGRSFLKADANCNFIVDKLISVPIPKTWTVSKSQTKDGVIFIFSRIEGNCPVPIIERCVTVDDRKHLNYFIVGKKVEPDLPNFLEDFESFPGTLLNFGSMGRCLGLGNLKPHLIDSSTAFQDTTGAWRHNKCAIIAITKKCRLCIRARKSLLQRARRYEKLPHLKRIRTLTNHVDQKKLKEMREIYLRERRKRLRAESARESRAKLQVKMTRPEYEKTLEEKCMSLNIAKNQKTLLKEILAAGKPANAHGQRYSEEWITLCMLLNTRSPSYYEFLRKLEVIPLPCSRTIRRYFSLMDSKCENDAQFADSLGEYLRKRFELPKGHRQSEQDS